MLSRVSAAAVGFLLLAQANSAWAQQSSGVISGPAAANPSATATGSAINGTGATYMRSDAAPAIQNATNGQKGLAQVDGSTITASGGTISAASTTINGATCTPGGSCSPASGGLVLISTQTANNSVELDFTGLGSSYNTYMLDCSGIIPATNTASMGVQFGEGGTPTWKQSGYFESLTYQPSVGTAGTTLSEAATAIQITAAVSSAATGVARATVWISDIASTALYKSLSGKGLTVATDGHAYQVNDAGFYHADTVAVTAIRVLASTGNISSGRCSLYGLTP